MVKATNIDINGKQRKLKNLVPGKCSFPFKYRRKMVFTCQPRNDGNWCATNTDHNKKPLTWGYCKNTGKKTTTTQKKCPPEKVLNPKTGRCIKKINPQAKKTAKILTKKNTHIKPKVNNGEKVLSIRNNLLADLRKNGKNIDCKIFSDPDSKLKFLGAGVANKVYLSCITKECKRKVALRLMTIDNTIKYNINHPNKVELRAYDTFNSLLQRNITQHIPYKINNFKCKINSLLNTNIGNNARGFQYSYYINSIKEEVDILVTEFCKFGHARGFLNKNMYKMNDTDLKVFIFQLMSGIVTLQYHIPEFKHNDLHSENVLVGNYNLKQKKGGNNSYIKYILFKKEFYIPLREYCVKIYDFDTMNGKGFNNSKIDDLIYKEVGVTKKNNPVFDYHLSMNSIFKKEDFIPTKQPETLKFFHEQVPEEYRGNSNNFISYARLTNYKINYNLENTNLIPNNIQTPSHVLLNNPYFDEFRKKPSNCKIVDVIDSKIPAFDKVKKLKYMFK